jgi:hypothetical protein
VPAVKRYSTESFQRGAEIGRASCRLRAQTYNLMRLLLARAGDSLFVPIRPMQYLAVVDAEEVIFVDGQDRRWIELAWKDFRPAARSALDEPVPYEVVYYRASGRGTAPRISAEFPRAIGLLAERDRSVRGGWVVDFPGRAPRGGRSDKT